MPTDSGPRRWRFAYDWSDDSGRANVVAFLETLDVAILGLEPDCDPAEATATPGMR